jgi:hypothetical protein
LNPNTPNNKFDFVCTSEACFRIKKKMNSTAFGKNTASTPNILAKVNADMPSDTMGMFQTNQRQKVSPNMMLKKTKTAKEIKMELKIKEIFDNDPI